MLFSLLDNLVFSPSPHMKPKCYVSQFLFKKNWMSKKKDNFTYTYFVSSLYETQNEYCWVYEQQLLYEKLINHKNANHIKIDMDYL
jgi:hypothetical protein